MKDRTDQTKLGHDITNKPPIWLFPKVAQIIYKNVTAKSAGRYKDLQKEWKKLTRDRKDKNPSEEVVQKIVR